MSTESENILKINKALDDLDARRSDHLESLKRFKDVENKVRKKELERLTIKYGADHPRIQKMSNQIDFNKNISGSLAYEIERSKIAVPRFDKNTWMIHGRVLSDKFIGIEGLTVSLFDENVRWIRAFGYKCTDGKGYFAIIYDPGKDDNKEKPTLQKVFLHVSDENKNPLLTDNEPFNVETGRIFYKELILSGKSNICTPPETEE